MLTQDPPTRNVANSAVICVETPDGSRERYDITPENNLIVGSSKNCTIRLTNGDVAGMHCLIRMFGGQLSVQDWYTTAGTYLNGRKLMQPESFGPRDEIRVGDYRLRAEFNHGVAAPQAAIEEDERPKKPIPPQQTTEQDAPDRTTPVNGEAAALERLRGACAAETEPRDSAAEWEASTAPQAKPPVETSPAASASKPAENTAGSAAAQEELDSLRQRVTELELENEELRQRDTFWEEGRTAGAADPFDAEMVELLKAEVEQLQTEVAQRDAKILELGEAAEAGARPDAEEDSPDTAALVDRLERMLDELQASDERAVGLENLLREADEATRAEQEERKQLAAWVGDIEERIAQREAEWRADEQVLQQRLEELTQERQQFDERLRDLTRRQGATAQAQMISEFRAQVDDLKKQLEAAERERDTLRKKIESVEFQNTAEGIEKRVEEALRQERMELSQEHARIARERAEVARLQANVAQTASTEPPKPKDVAASRVQSLRRQIAHDQTNRHQGESEPRSLTARIASLWKRLDGN